MDAAIAHADRAHSSVGGSSAKRIMECPGSLKLSEQYPSRSSEFAEEGTAMHEALDLILQGKTQNDSEVVGLVLNGLTITQEMYDEGIAPALEMFDELDRELGGIEFLNEARVVFPDIDGAFGTVDIVGTAKDRSLVIDWKMGRGVAVEAAENGQLLYYAYAAAHTPATAKFFSRDKPIELVIIQPRVKDGEPFTRWVTTYLQLDAYALELRKAVAEALGPDPTFKLGEHCRFCPAKIGCPLYQNKAEAGLALSRDELTAHIADWLPDADALIALGEMIKETAHNLLEQGAAIPGWKLVAKRANRSWADEDRALKYFSKVGLPAADRHVKKIISPKQAEDALKRHGLPAELPAALVDKVSSGTTLAPESDKRSAVPIAPGALQLLGQRLAGR